MLDLATIVVGPVSTLRLAGYGAKVIKLEPPGGDLLRTLGDASPTGAHSGTFLHLNSGMHGLYLDMKAPGAARVLNRLLDTTDAVVTNTRPDALERLGLDAASVRTTRPALVHCVITGYGPGGPYCGRPAYDIVIHGASGVAGAFERRQPRWRRCGVTEPCRKQHRAAPVGLAPVPSRPSIDTRPERACCHSGRDYY